MSPPEHDPQENELAQAVYELRDQVQVLWHAIDELREGIEYALRNGRGPDWYVEPPGTFHDPAPGRYRDDPADEFDEDEEGSKPTTDVGQSTDKAEDTPSEPLDTVPVVDEPASGEPPPPTAANIRPATTPQPAPADPVADKPSFPDFSTLGSPANHQRGLFDFDRHQPAAAPAPAVTLAEPVGDSPKRGHESGAITTTTAEQPSYTLDDYHAFQQRLADGGVTAAAFHEEFARLRHDRDRLIAQLVADHDAKKLQLMALRCGCVYAKQNRKDQNAEAIYRALLSSYSLGQSITYQPMAGETYEDAVTKIVESLTDDDIQACIAQTAKEQQQEKRALANPQTRDDFRRFVLQHGEDRLSEEQRARYDQFRADETRAARKAKKPATVEQIQGDGVQGLKITITQGYHEQQQIPLWICQLSDRVDRPTFDEFKRKASQLGGWWSSFKKSQAGFQFKNEESARKFAGLLDAHADRTDELAARHQRKLERTGQHLDDLAESLEDEAAEILQADATRLQNTARRAEMAAGMRGRAHANNALAATLRSLARALESGEAQYLDGVRTRTQIELLITTLRRAKWARIRSLPAYPEGNGHAGRYDDLAQRPPEPADVLFAEYPYPTLYRGHIEHLFAKAKGRRGPKQRCQRLGKWLDSHPDAEYIRVTQQDRIEFFEDFLGRCRGAGLSVDRLESAFSDYKRMRAAGIHTAPELRCALRELLPHLVEAQGDDPVRKAEKELIGKDIPGFFPTPRPLIERMLSAADLRPGDRVLEPSCGKGDILDVIREQSVPVQVTAVEQNRTFEEVLAAKGHDVTFVDFLEYSGDLFNRIILNPPFERGQDTQHVRHAFNLLAPGGRLVTIMSEGPFFRENGKDAEFREWLDHLGATHEQLPDDTFRGIDAFRQTGVRTRLVIIDKPVAAADSDDELHRRYHEQQERLSCPGCGETPFIDD